MSLQVFSRISRTYASAKLSHRTRKVSSHIYSSLYRVYSGAKLPNFPSPPGDCLPEYIAGHTAVEASVPPPHVRDGERVRVARARTRPGMPVSIIRGVLNTKFKYKPVQFHFHHSEKIVKELVAKLSKMNY